jgi:hypothetical protein
MRYSVFPSFLFRFYSSSNELSNHQKHVFSPVSNNCVGVVEFGPGMAHVFIDLFDKLQVQEWYRKAIEDFFRVDGVPESPDYVNNARWNLFDTSALTQFHLHWHNRNGKARSYACCLLFNSILSSVMNVLYAIGRERAGLKADSEQ